MANKLVEMFRKNAAVRQENEEPVGAEEAKAGAAQDAQEQPEAEADERTKLKEDVKLLLSLFPKLNVSAVPDEVWDKVRDGDSLSAAYCLWLVRTVKEKKRIDELNSKNRLASLPPVNDDSKREGFFTRETVKNMSREQIRKNLDGILRSMDSWK